MKKWEYTMATATNSTPESEHKFLNEQYGIYGWQCFFMKPIASLQERTMYYFKREARADTDAEEGR